jgi:hypothetical protein
VSVLVWAMIGIALWHLAVLVPDRFVGGIIGAFIAATAGALVTGYLLPTPGLPAARRDAGRLGAARQRRRAARLVLLGRPA